MRMLLHQRLLLALMLVTLALTVLFSVLLTEMREVLLALGETGAPAQGREIDEDFLEKAGQATEMASSLFFAGFYWFTALAGTLVTLFICFRRRLFRCSAAARFRMSLSRPVSRAQFILGKYCGAAAVMLGYSLLAGAALVVFAYANGLELSLAARWAPWLMFCHNLMAGSAAAAALSPDAPPPRCGGGPLRRGGLPVPSQSPLLRAAQLRPLQCLHADLPGAFDVDGARSRCLRSTHSMSR